MPRFSRMTVLNARYADSMVPPFYLSAAAFSQRIGNANGDGGSRLPEFTQSPGRRL